MGALQGKAVVITGAGRGLGREYALHAARAGAAVVVNDVYGEPAREVAALITEAGGRAEVSTRSVADAGEAAEIVDQCVRAFGTIDGLVNNAGLNYQAPPWDDDPARVRALVEVNVLGTMFTGMAALRVMRERGSGVIVNVASGALLGKRGGAAYSASKGAVASLTYSWAADLTELGIRVNAISPLAWTRMVEADRVERARLSRDLTPDLAAPLVTFLLSDRSAGVSGQLIRLRGEKLHLVRQHSVKEPVLTRPHWDVEDFAAAFDGELVPESPPAIRWKL
ncbi:SDR family NAD(P)-dependent oxidoreductase [Amycolatopsis sp. 195334CR]|uniref:SDR family NAD(P)-dependent oxidoreductase n=1 Tax=Amycolatopsis sp. 195334CR TaxID=2814588 RepID=UPI001A8DF614|nr:SDR family oxidoreductase [Amycolatopsis sp. 195334CR]MBN6041364.1 SDR family oxidoreductase [Amycolatopsis sp. 195334CR]